jgi:hypothetical protein
MRYIEINNQRHTLIAAEGGMSRLFKNADRQVEGYTLQITHAAAVTAFVDGVSFSLIEESVDEAGTVTEIAYDKSAMSIPCGVLDNLDGTCTVFMGKPTDLEQAYELLYGGI